MAVIRVLQTGSTLVSPAVPDRSTRKSEIAYTGLFQSRKNRISVPVKAFLVTAVGHTVLIDTGWSADCVHHPIRHMGFGLWFASEPVIKEGEAVDQQLQQLGISQQNIDAILMTHLDCDHASGLLSLTGIRKIYVTKEEIAPDNLRNVRYHKSFWKGISFSQYPMREDAAAPFGKSADLFEDGSVVVYFTPTHSAGSVMIKVTENDRFALFVGDNGYNRNSWEKLRLPGPIYSKENMRHALAYISEQSRRTECAGIYAAHDPEVLPGIYEF